jgi:hypothetical protein
MAGDILGLIKAFELKVPMSFGDNGQRNRSLQGVVLWCRFLQGFQIFNSATLLKSASLVARFVSPFRLIIADGQNP